MLRILYRWLEEQDEITAVPMAKMRPPIVPDQPVPVVPDDGLRRLFTACAGTRFEDRRDTALLMLLLDTGARRAELTGLRLTDVDRAMLQRYGASAADAPRPRGPPPPPPPTGSEDDESLLVRHTRGMRSRGKTAGQHLRHPT